MAVTVETGSVVAGANSYADISVSDTYHADRGNTAWGAATEPQKTAALLKATSYLDGKYRRRWKGYRVQPIQQALEWPRVGVAVDGSYLSGYSRSSNYNTYYNNYPSNRIPEEIVAATCELALRALSAPLVADIAPADRLKRKKVDVIEKEFVPGDFQTSYPVVEQLISRFLRSGNDTVRG